MISAERMVLPLSFREARPSYPDLNVLRLLTL